ncbi:MAG: phosphotransferase-like protein [Dehalococcoidia bacterium]
MSFGTRSLANSEPRTHRPFEPVIIVITGIQAAGKSTVARLLAQRFARGVHIEADALQRMIVSGAAWVGEPGPPAGEAERQLRMRLRHMCLLSGSFFDAGFTVVLDDIIIGDRWKQLQEELHGRLFSLAVLAPDVDAVLSRDADRAKRTLGEAWARYLDKELRATMAGVGLWLDTTSLTPEETVDEVLRHLWSRTAHDVGTRGQ